MGGVRALGGGLEAAAGYGLATAGAGISTTGLGALVGVPAAALALLLVRMGWIKFRRDLGKLSVETMWIHSPPEICK